MPKRGANLEARLEQMAAALADQPLPGVFDVVQAIAVDKANGRAPGLYPVGPPGSTAGVLVYDPAQGKPRVPADKMSSCGMLIVSEGATWDTVL